MLRLSRTNGKQYPEIDQQRNNVQAQADIAMAQINAVAAEKGRHS